MKLIITSLARAGLMLLGLLVLHPDAAEASHSNRDRHCTEEEAMFQVTHSRAARISICDSTDVWRFAQFTDPAADVFFDVGGNRGYTAAMIFSLWSPGHKLDRASLKQAAVENAKTNLTRQDMDLDTYCKDGKSTDSPIVCFGQSMWKSSSPCAVRRPIQVFSFDGQTNHVHDTRFNVYKKHAELQPHHTGIDSADRTNLVRASWEYVHAAITDIVEDGKDFGYFVEVPHEGGRLVSVGNDDQAAKRMGKNILVPIDSIDRFVQKRNLDHVDVLKVDAEGNDIKVIRGALDTIKNKNLKLISVECWDCTNTIWMKEFTMLEDLGFECYLNGQAHLTIRITGNCYPTKEPTLGNGAPGALNSNAYCVHKDRAPALYAVIDDMAIYHFANGHNAHVRFLPDNGLGP